MIDCKEFVETLNNKPVAVFGLGLSGIATIQALSKSGAKVIAWDDNETTHDKAAKAGADVRPLDDATIKTCAYLILAPGVPLHYPKPHPVVKLAHSHDVEIIGDLEILYRCAGGRKIIGITGTNGKSTTTALIGHILKNAGKKVTVGGNIGDAALGLKLPAKDGFIVLEISSYQMDLSPTFTPDIAVLLNITPDHIDRHGTFKNYAASKQRIFEGEGTAVISLDDQACCRIYERLISFETGNREVCPISCEGEVEEGVYAENETLFDTRLDAPEIGSIASIRTLRGQHNHQNIAAAYAACRAAGVEPEIILEHVKTFEGLPHRQYPVRTINGVGYVNDSKATNAEAASKALGAYKNIYWIAGGRPKGTGLEDILPFIQSIKHAFLIGEAMTAFAAWLDQYSIPYTLSGTLDAAVQDAHKAAQESRSQPGGAGTVLLSPACASFDQFPSYAKRGEVFTDLVNNLPEEEEAAA